MSDHEGDEAVWQALADEHTLDIASYFTLHPSSKLSDFLAYLARGKSGWIHSLDLSNNKLLHRDGVNLGEALLKQRSVKSLVLSQNFTKDALSTLLSAQSSLTHLDLSRNNVQHRSACTLGKALRDNGTLVYLDLSRNDLGPVGVTHIAEALEWNAILKTLILYDTRADKQGGQAMFKALRVNTTLETLDFSYNSLQAEGVKALEDSEWVNSTLKKLDLSGNALQSDGARAVAKMISNEQVQIEALNVSYNKLGSAGGNAIISALLTNKTIKHIDMTSNKLSGDNGSLLGQLMLENGTLSVLNLAGNHLRQGCLPLLRNLKMNKSLSHIDLTGNGMRDEGAAAVVELLREPCNVQALILDNNGIRFIDLASLVLSPSFYQNVYKAMRISLAGNDLQNPPIYVCESAESLIAYLSDLRKGATHLKHLKLMLVGHGGVGKTTLAKTLFLNKRLYTPDIASWDNAMLQSWLHDMGFSETVLECFRHRNGEDLASETKFLQVLSKGKISQQEAEHLSGQVTALKKQAETASRHQQHLYVSTRGVDAGEPLQMKVVKSSIDHVQLGERKQAPPPPPFPPPPRDDVSDDSDDEPLPTLRQPSVRTLPNVELTVVDLAGQLEYIMSHAVFFRALYAVYIVCSNLTHHPLQLDHNVLGARGVAANSDAYSKNEDWDKIVFLWMNTLRSLLGSNVPVRVALTFADAYTQKLGYEEEHLKAQEHALTVSLRQGFPTWFPNPETQYCYTVNAVDPSKGSNPQHHPLYEAIRESVVNLCQQVVVPVSYEAAKDAVSKQILIRRHRKLLVMKHDELMPLLGRCHAQFQDSPAVLGRAYQYLVDSLELLEVTIKEEKFNILDPLNWLASTMAVFVVDPLHHPLLPHVPGFPGVYDWTTIATQKPLVCGIPFATETDVQTVMDVLCELGVCFRPQGQETKHYGGRGVSYVFPSCLPKPTPEELQLNRGLPGYVILGRSIRTHSSPSLSNMTHAMFPPVLINHLQLHLRQMDSLGKSRILSVKLYRQAIVLMLEGKQRRPSKLTLVMNSTYEVLDICIDAEDHLLGSRVIEHTMQVVQDIYFSNLPVKPPVIVGVLCPNCLRAQNPSPGLHLAKPISLDTPDPTHSLKGEAVMPAWNAVHETQIKQSNGESVCDTCHVSIPERDLLDGILTNLAKTADGECPEPFPSPSSMKSLLTRASAHPNPSEQEEEEKGEEEKEKKDDGITFFLSHRGPDTKEALARPVAYLLQHFGIRTFLDADISVDNATKSIPLGSTAEAAIAEGLYSCKWGVILLSQNFDKSSWCVKEFNTLIRRDKRRNPRQTSALIPVFYDVSHSDTRFAPFLHGLNGVLKSPHQSARQFITHELVPKLLSVDPCKDLPKVKEFFAKSENQRSEYLDSIILGEYHDHVISRGLPVIHSPGNQAVPKPPSPQPVEAKPDQIRIHITDAESLPELPPSPDEDSRPADAKTQTQTQKTSPPLHQDLKDWLRKERLSQYEAVLAEEDVLSMDDLRLLTLDQLKAMGISKQVHLNKLARAARQPSFRVSDTTPPPAASIKPDPTAPSISEELHAWLVEHRLEVYINLFAQEDVLTLEDLALLSEADLFNMGITKLLHLKKLRTVRERPVGCCTLL